MSDSTATRKTRFRLFLEGIEVELVGGSVTAGINSPAQAQITIPATASALEIKPRTLVHLFFFDSRVVSAATKDGTPGGATQDSAGVYASSWKLLFVGEVVGYGYNLVGGLRQCQLSCSDVTSYWQQAQLYWGANKGKNYTGKQAIAMGATQLQKSVGNGNDAIIKLISGKSLTWPTLPGLLGGIIALLESVVGVYDTKPGNSEISTKFKGVNAFMAQAELRLHLTKMLIAAPNDDSSARFIDSKENKQFWRMVSKSLGQTSSYMQLVNILLEKVYHRWASVLAPPFVTKLPVVARITRTFTRKNFSDPELAAFYNAARAAYEIVAQRLEQRGRRAVDTSNGESLLYGEDNVRFKVTQRSVEDYSLESAVTSEAVTVKVIDVEGHTNFSAGISKTGLMAYDRDRVEPLQVRMRAGAERSGLQGASVRTQLEQNALAFEDFLTAAELLRAVVSQSGSVDDPYPYHTYENLVRIREDLDSGLSRINDVVVTKVEEVKNDNRDPRLVSFLFTPDIYAAPPPACNVLFPDMYTSISFSEAWLTQPTRLWMHSRTTGGTDKKDVYFAPDVSQVPGNSKKNAQKAIESGESFVMRHERFTGVVPALEGLGDVNIFKKAHQEQTKKEAASKDDTAGNLAGFAKGSSQEHLMRAANFIFFAKRFEPRNIMLRARFCPQLIVGMPALVLVPEINASRPDGDSARHGVHYLGTVGSVSHSFDASGGVETQVQLIKCRRHNEGMDILDPDGDNEKEVKKRRPTGGRKLKGTYLGRYDGVDYRGNAKTDHLVPAGLIPPISVKKGGSYTIAPYAGSPTESVTSRRRTLGSNFRTEAPDNHVLVSFDAASRSAAATANSRSSIDEQYSELPPAGTIYLKVEVYEGGSYAETTSKVKFTLEDTLTPPWFADAFRRKNIGTMFYEPLFYCRSVIDASETQTTSTEYAERLVDGTPAQSAIVALPSEGDSIETAADKLARTWLNLVEIGADLSSFEESYVRRSYATMDDMLNVVDAAGTRVRVSQETRFGEADAPAGFHASAFSDVYGAFTDIPGAAEALSTATGIGDKAEAATFLDTRLEKNLAVQNYLRELRSVAAGHRDPEY